MRFNSEDAKPTRTQEWPTREAAQAAALSACDWNRLYEVANHALMIDRRAWGDELKQSAGAAQTWSAFCFVISAAPYVECRFLPSKDQSGRGANIIEGAVVEKMSFELARRVACALMGPLPPRQTAGSEDHGEKALFALDERLDEAYEVLEEMQSRILSAPRAASRLTAQSTPAVGRYDIGELLVGPSSRHPKYWTAESLLSSVENCSWEDLASCCVTTDSPLPSSVFEEARIIGGYSLVGAGASGGFGKAKEQARELIACAVALCSAIKAPCTQAAGLGGLAMYVNGVAEAEPEAVFYKKSFAIHFPTEMFGFAHEWIHALDHLTWTQGPSGVKDALKKTRKVMAEQKPDALEARAYAKIRKQGLRGRQNRALQPSISALLASHGRPEVRDLESSASREAQRFIMREIILAVGDEGRASCMKKIVKVLRPWLDSALGSADPSLVRDLAWEACAHAREESMLAKHLAEGKSLFCASAMAEDEHFNTWVARAKPYWAAPAELLARVGESFFLTQASQSGLVSMANPPSQGLDDLKLAPEGFERLVLTASIGSWIQESLPWLLRMALHHQKDVLPLGSEEICSKSSSVGRGRLGG